MHRSSRAVCESFGALSRPQSGIEVTLRESTPTPLCEALLRGEIDVALMARPEGFGPPFKAIKLYSERFVVACAAGHHFANRPAVKMAELDGEFYLQRINCEFRDFLADMCKENGARLIRSYRSEREDWILTMVAAGLGVCFLPQDTACFPGVIGCPVISPEVRRNVCLVTVEGRTASSPAKAFVHCVRGYPWPSATTT